MDMDILIFIYNIILLIIYSCTLTCTFYIFLKNKQPLFLTLSVMLVFYLLDNTIIYMTEFIDTFSARYDMLFMSVPAFKTVIIISTSLCYLYIFWLLLKRPIGNINYAPVIVHALILMFIPILQGGAFQVWLYYLPSQVFLFLLSLYTMYEIKKDPQTFSNGIYKSIVQMLKISMLFCVLIVIEDTIVIFNYDIYSDVMVKINNRSISEDLLSIYFCIFTIKYSLIYDRECSNNQTYNNSSIDIVACEATMSNNCSNTNESSLYPVDSDFELFCVTYQLTGREKELLKKLLDDKTNQEISEELFISLGTVKTHVHNIFQKVGASKRNQLLKKYNLFTQENH